MADYNIYIHSDTSGVSADSATKPWTGGSGDGEGSTKPNGGVAQAIQKAVGFIGNPDAALANGVSDAAKAVPWVAAAVAIIKTVTGVTGQLIDISTVQSGSYGAQKVFNDITTVAKSFLTPASTILGMVNADIQWKNASKVALQNLKLLGESTNSYGYGARGYGL